MAVAFIDNKVIVGERALQQIQRYPTSGRKDFLHHIGDDNVIESAEQTLSGNDALFSLFQHIAAIVKEAAQTVNDATVITVPPWFHDVQRQLVRDSAEKAGFQVFRLINRPTALVLSHWFRNQKTINRFLVCELQGENTHLTIVKIHEGNPEIEASNAILPNQDSVKCLRAIVSDAAITPDAIEAILITHNITALIDTCKTVFAQDPIVLTQSEDHAAIGAALFAALSRKQQAPQQSVKPEAEQRSGCLLTIIIFIGGIASSATCLISLIIT
jgi:molecular chaperone DnaK (HSP70)